MFLITAFTLALGRNWPKLARTQSLLLWGRLFYINPSKMLRSGRVPHLEHRTWGRDECEAHGTFTCWFWLIEHSAYSEFGASLCPEQSVKENSCRFRWQWPICRVCTTVRMKNALPSA